MRLGLWCPRADHLRVLGPIIDAAKRRGWDGLLLLPRLSGIKDAAHEQRESVERQAGWAATTPGASPSDLNGIGKSFDWITAVGLHCHGSLRSCIGGRWASLPYRQEELLALLTRGPAALDGWALATTASAAGLAVAQDLAPNLGTRIALEKMVPVGDPILDPVPALDRAACRMKWGLPAGKPVVFFAPAARPAHLPGRYRWFFDHGGLHRWAGPFCGVAEVPSYRATVEAVRRWADRHGALLVAKTRTKHRDPAWLPVDRLIGDECFHPFATLELLAAADAYVGFASALAVEATACGLVQRHLLAWPTEMVEVPEYLPLRHRFYERTRGLWNGPLASQHRLFEPDGLAGFRLWAEAGTFPARFAPAGAAARTVVSEIAGPLGGAADRFLDLLDNG